MNDACIMLGVKGTTIRGLVDNGMLATTLDGQRRLVLTSSIYDRLCDGIARLSGGWCPGEASCVPGQAPSRAEGRGGGVTFAFTILEAPASKHANKIITPTATVPYDNVTYWKAYPRELTTLEAMAGALEWLADRPRR